MQAVEALGEVTQSAGPLDSKTRALVKLAIAVGALREDTPYRLNFLSSSKLGEAHFDVAPVVKNKETRAKQRSAASASQ